MIYLLTVNVLLNHFLLCIKVPNTHFKRCDSKWYFI